MRSLQLRRRGPLLGVTFAVMLAACSSDGAGTTTTTANDTTTSTVAATTTTEVADPTTTTVAATTTTTISEAEALAVVASAFAAFNSGDMETWFLWREGGQAEPGDGDYELAVQSRIDVQECVHRGYGEWIMDNLMTGHAFDCPATQTDLFLEAAGIVLQMNYEWVIGEDPESSLAGSNEDFVVAEVLMAGYRAWLADAYPEVEASIDYEPDSPYPLPESVSTALQYIDEFVAQSDFYPLTEPVPPLD